MRLVLLSIVLLTSAGCSSLGFQAPPSAHANAGLATAYVFRGVTRNERPVAQADLTLAATRDNGDVLSTTVWGNMDLDNDTGDAAFPDGNDFDFTEIDLVVDYARDFGDIAGSAGLINYNFPNVGARSTTELYVGGRMSDVFLTPSLTAFLDVDEVDGLYLNGAIGHGWPINEQLELMLAFALGWASDHYAEDYYNASSSGLADVMLSASLAYVLDASSSVSVSLTQWAILDDDLEDGLDDADIESDALVLAVGYGWSL